MLGVAVVDTRKYPFLADPERLARSRYGVGLWELHRLDPSLPEKGLRRLEHAVRKARAPEPLDSLEEEVLSFYYAAALARLAGCGWLCSRLALAEANRAHDLLVHERDEVLVALGRLVGLSTLSYGRGLYRAPVARVRGVTVYEQYDYGIGFVEYVKAGRRLLGDPLWSPVNLPVMHGVVYLKRGQLTRLLKEALTGFIEAKIKGIELPSPEGRLADYVEKARQLAARGRAPGLVRGGRIEIPKGAVVEEAFPPCMVDLLQRARRGENLSHHERFALATFLLNIGADVDYVVDVFQNMPDFNEKITRYQVEHLAGLRGSGKKYRTYSCENMKTLGICRADCSTRSPLQAYYRALRRLAKQAQGGSKESSGSKA